MHKIKFCSLLTIMRLAHHLKSSACCSKKKEEEAFCYTFPHVWETQNSNPALVGNISINNS